MTSTLPPLAYARASAGDHAPDHPVTDEEAFYAALRVRRGEPPIIAVRIGRERILTLAEIVFTDAFARTVALLTEKELRFFAYPLPGQPSRPPLLGEED